jgi:ATP-dependent exoDNAse (exonuclease V) alpha subunit
LVISVDPVTGVSVYREIDREFSFGDRIQFTSPDKSLGVANRDLATIESISPGGRISARLDNNRQVEFDAMEHRHFDHGYAVTSYSSQGLNAERVLVNADTGVHPDLLNSRFGYVPISRASHEATLLTNDIAKLGQQLGTDITKTSDRNRPNRLLRTEHWNWSCIETLLESADCTSGYPENTCSWRPSSSLKAHLAHRMRFAAKCRKV